jgi:hypothetical protein
LVTNHLAEVLASLIGKGFRAKRDKKAKNAKLGRENLQELTEVPLIEWTRKGKLVNQEPAYEKTNEAV